jgi:hypothetical protein
MTESASTTNSTTSTKGKAGRTDYDKWHKVTNTLVQDVETEEKLEAEDSTKALGLDGKYAHSAADAEERQKSKDVKKAKKELEKYLKRETSIKETMQGLLGPVPEKDDSLKSESEESKTAASEHPQIVRITRNDMKAGKRVVSLADTSGNSRNDTIVLTHDLSSLESKMKANALAPKKDFKGDVDNGVVEEEKQEYRSILGLIKCFISNVHNCTIIVKCKLISGTIEMNHCSNVTLRIEKEAVVATLQIDLCSDIQIEFRDAPSGKNTNQRGQSTIFWGEDKEDRIFHAGVSSMVVKVIRDDYVETERVCDYKADDAKTFGNATPEEFQFVTSVMEGELVTEAVVRAGSTTGKNARAMTQRELDDEKVKRDQAAKVAVGMAENMIRFKEVDKEGSNKVKKATQPLLPAPIVQEEEEEIEEVYGSMGKEDIDQIVKECEQNKVRGNEAFGAGEYAQAVLLYSVAMDKADELPDADDAEGGGYKQLWSRDVTLSNRAACFLKLGHHEKAEADAKRAVTMNSKNVKAIFRRGLALHAMKEYQQAIPLLAEALKLEPNNKQIKQALQFAEVRMTQEHRKRMEG